MLRSLTSSIINVVKCHNPNSIRIEQKLFRPVIYPIFFILFFFIINIYTPLKIILFLLGGWSCCGWIDWYTLNNITHVCASERSSECERVDATYARCLVRGCVVKRHCVWEGTQRNSTTLLFGGKNCAIPFPRWRLRPFSCKRARGGGGIWPDVPEPVCVVVTLQICRGQRLNVIWTTRISAQA